MTEGVGEDVTGDGAGADDVAADDVAAVVGAAEGTLPGGRSLELRRRGTTWIREVDGPAGAPTVVLLHGWLASGGLNWFRAFGPLSQHFRVVAPDLRGHARGLRSWRRFTLDAVADDTAATLVELGTGPVVAVGYSMGGPVAQLLFRRHRDLVAGLVLCATSGGFLPVMRERVVFQTMMAAASVSSRMAEGVLRRLPLLGAPGVLPVLETAEMRSWAAAELRRHDVRHVIEAGHAIGTYHAADWLPEVDVPAVAVVTTDDRAVDPVLQVAMADRIPGCEVHPFEGGHLACAARDFGDHLLAACLSVAERADTRPGATARPAPA